MCYFFIGLVIKIPAISGLMESFVTTLQENGAWWANILLAIRECVKGRIICVFGCGGDRDKTKRPIMGEIAGRLSDISIVTSDNPRSEDPTQIILEIEEGLRRTNKEYLKIVDRAEAIFKALSIAKLDDVVVIAGKGHEPYQILNDKIIHFDDREQVKIQFEKLRK